VQDGYPFRGSIHFQYPGYRRPIFVENKRRGYGNRTVPILAVLRAAKMSERKKNVRQIISSNE